MARDLLSDDPDFVTEFETRLSNRQLVKSLSVIRARAKLSQQELASRMGCSQSKISKIESGIDSDLRFGDIEAYLKATSHEAKICVVPQLPQDVNRLVHVETPETNDVFVP